MTPLVSIIIPCYNAERWLAQSLESALGQTWPAKEILVINDGSRDGSLAVAQCFTTRGEFIQFLDADDLLSADKLTRQIALLRSQPADTLASCAWGRFSSDVSAAQFTDTPVFRDFQPVDFLVLAGDTGAMMHPSAWLVPRVVAGRAGPWDEALSLNDDGEYFCRVLLASSGVAFCADPAARSYYRSGLPGSLSQQRGENARHSQFRSLELIARHLCAAEDSPRTRQAAANYFQRFIHDFYPAPADLMQAAAAQVSALGGSSLPVPPMGPRTRRLAALLGWKTVWRLKYLLGR